MPFPPKPFKRKPKPVNPKPRPAGKDYVTEAELWCRSINSALLGAHIIKLKRQLEIAEAIRAERQAAEATFHQMTLAELEAVVAKAVPGPELAVAQQVLNARKPKPAGEKKTMPPKPPRRPMPPRPAGPGGPPWRNKNG